MNNNYCTLNTHEFLHYNPMEISHVIFYILSSFEKYLAYYEVRLLLFLYILNLFVFKHKEILLY